MYALRPKTTQLTLQMPFITYNPLLHPLLHPLSHPLSHPCFQPKPRFHTKRSPTAGTNVSGRGLAGSTDSLTYLYQGLDTFGGTMPSLSLY